MLILHVGPRDMGEYIITAENALGRAECSTVLSVRGKRKTLYFRRILQLKIKNIPNDIMFFFLPPQTEESKGNNQYLF